MKFEMWGWIHYFMLIGPFVFAILLHHYSKYKSYEEKRKIGIFLSLIAISLLIARNIELALMESFSKYYDIIPFQVCHFANFVLLYAFYKDDKTFFSLAFTLNLLAAYLSLLFANGLAGYSSIINVRGFAYIFGHMLIVIITLWAYLNKFVVMSKKTYKKTLITIITLLISSVVLNNLFRILFNQRSNYFYTRSPQNGTPLETIYNMGTLINIGSFEINLVYFILLTIFTIFVTFTVYSIGFLIPEYLSNKPKKILSE